MGRLGPLTSQALGRSPYDDVVEGTGEEDPHEPPRQYDEKGRIVNPETKRIIKNVIRAHNEVMLVIGVAEPENGEGESAEITMAKEHQAYETRIGRRFLDFGRKFCTFGIWGIHGVRQRIALYRPYSNVEFWRLAHFERQHRSLRQIIFTGLPSLAVMHGIDSQRALADWDLWSPWLRAGVGWCYFHLHLFLTMQRLGLVPASRWLPGYKFFVPFSSTSPIAAPPKLERLDGASIRAWLAQLAINVAPYAVYYLFKHSWSHLNHYIWPRVHKRLPQPSKSEQFALRSSQVEQRPIIPDDTWQTVPESPTLGVADREIRHGRSPDQDIPTLQALEGQATAVDSGIPLGTIRRQSTFSSRGGDQDYGTDEEDAEMINPTLISFDVDTTESTEQPAGVWSAELRPSISGDGRSTIKEEIHYMVNPLTSLPAMLAADIITNFLTNIVCSPLEVMAIRGIGRAFARRRGLPMTDMYDISLMDGLSWRGLGNFLGLEIVKLLVSGEAWAIVSLVSQAAHSTEEEWAEERREEQEEIELERRQQVTRETVARLEAAAEAQ